MLFQKAIVATWRGQLTEDSARSIVTGETGFAHTRAVVLSAHVLLLYSLCNAGFGCRMVSMRLDAHFGVVAKCADFGTSYPLSMTRAATSSTAHK
jgi:hypothetical protein